MMKNNSHKEITTGTRKHGNFFSALPRFRGCFFASIFFLFLLAAPFLATFAAAADVFRVDDLKPGMKGYGLSVFSGTKIEKFDVEVLGVLKKAVSGQDMVLIRMAGMGLEHSGTVAGMSGSPVYIDGKILGAVAYGWGFQKDPIAGVTPITDMLKLLEQPAKNAGNAAPAGWSGGVSGALPGVGPFDLLPVPTPVMMGGFTPAGAAKMKEFLESRGMTPMAAGGATVEDENPEADNLQPGSAISVPLMTGDLEMSAVGTVTYRDGDRILAFGHPFLNSGPTEMPMGGAVVHTIMASYARSSKMASPTRILGGLLSDRLPAIMGRYGTFHEMIPMEISINDPDTGNVQTLNVKALRSDAYTAMLLMYAVWDSISRAIGDESGQGTVSITLDGEFEGYPKPFHFEDMAFHTDSAFEIGVIDHFLFLSSNKFRKIQLKQMRVKIEAERKIRMAEIQDITLSGARFKPGDTVNIVVHLRRYDGEEFTTPVSATIPPDTASGPLTLVVEGGEGIGLKYRVSPVNFEQFYDHAVSEWVPGNRIASSLIFRDASAGVEGEELPSLPGSVRGVLQDGLAAGKVQAMPRVTRELFTTGDVIRGRAQVQITVEKEFNQ